MTSTDEHTVSIVPPPMPPQSWMPEPRQSHPQPAQQTYAQACPRTYARSHDQAYAQTYAQPRPRMMAAPTYAQPYPLTRQQPFGDPPAGVAPGGVPLPVVPPGRSLALPVIGGVAGVLAVVGAVLATVFVFGGSSTIDAPTVEREIARSTQDAVHVAPTDVHCPAGVALAQGGTFTCTATLDAQPLTFTVTQSDDRGSVRFTGPRVLEMAKVEATGADIITRSVESPVRLDCRPSGATVLVNDPGTPISCIATRVGDPTDTADFSLTIDSDKKVTVKLAR